MAVRFSCFFFPGPVILASLCAACGGSTRAAPTDAGTTSDVAMAVALDAGCDGGGTGALTGTLDLAQPFVDAMTQWASAQVNLFSVFPSGTQAPKYTVALDAQTHEWAFGCLDPGAHYYVQGVAHFNVSPNGASIPVVVGPLTVPSSDKIALQIQPVQIEVLESRGAGTAMAVNWASVQVHDPGSGAAVMGATVTIDTGTGTPLPIPPAVDPNGVRAYYTAFLTKPPAQSTYTVHVTAADAGAPISSSWQVAADVPNFDGMITSPATGAALSATTPLTVTWAVEPQADFDQLTLFFSPEGGSYQSTYTSPAPDPPDGPLAGSETIPAMYFASSGPGDYLLNIAYTKANCPATSAGCVLAQAVADVQFTAH